MVIEKINNKFLVNEKNSIVDAINKIDSNKKGFVIVINSKGNIIGLLTDGDIRRSIVSRNIKNFELEVSLICNKKIIYSYNTTPRNELKKFFSQKVKFIPIVDSNNKICSIAFDSKHDFSISNTNIGEELPSFLIAEIGNNHNGSLRRALELIDCAVEAGADCAKFQMRNMQTMYRNNHKDEDLGAEYTLDLLSKFQLKKTDLFKAFDYCKKKNIIPLCTPFDHESLIELEKYGMDAYKLASADLTNHDLITELCLTQKPLICSTGMSTEKEITYAVDLMKSYGANFALLHCNSTYPAPYKDVNLKFLNKLKKIGQNCIIGYSGHERGYSIPIAAVAMGCKIIEKHFTTDRNLEGNDHRVSLLPNEFKNMVNSIREVEESLGNSESKIISQGEIINREFLAKSITSSRKIKKGEIISEKDIIIKSPGKGLQPYKKNMLIGKTAKRDIKQYDFFYQSDLNDDTIDVKNYKFDRPFGIPLRYHDYHEVINKSNFDIVEFHLSYRDMEINVDSIFKSKKKNIEFLVHSPELFSKDHIMDLCSEDKGYRKRSISELQKVIEITKSLNKFFPDTIKPKIIINAGGSSIHNFIDKSLRSEKYKLIVDSISKVDTNGVEILPQTMPPFPWHFGGQRYHNLFMDEDEIVSFCKDNDMRVCLDISHSKLYCNYMNKSFKNFLQKVSKYAAHIHMVDARGSDAEGLQIGDGEIDFKMVADVLKDQAPDISFIPEIWQGHKNSCYGFWVALNRLESFFKKNKI